MTDQATPAKVRLTDGLDPLINAEMAAYYEGEYGDHSVVKYRLHAFAQAVQAAERERWTRRVEEAFREGYYSRETYNDKDTTDVDEQWSRAKASLLRA